MRTPGTLGLVLVTACTLAGCASGTEPGMPNVLESDPDPRNVIVYVGNYDAGPKNPVMLYPVKVPVKDAPDVEAAVEALTTYEAEKPHTNSWTGFCARGKDLDKVTVTENMVTVHFNEHGGAACDMSQEGVDMISQQLAWTVRTAIDSTTPVRVTIGDDNYEGYAPVKADEKFLAPTQ